MNLQKVILQDGTRCNNGLVYIHCSDLISFLITKRNEVQEDGGASEKERVSFFFRPTLLLRVQMLRIPISPFCIEHDDLLQT